MDEVEELLKEIEVVESSTVEPPPDIDTRDHIVALMLTLICLANIVVCFFIIYIIKSFEKLRLQFFTCYILHCNVIMSGYLMLICVLRYIWLFEPNLYYRIECFRLSGGIVLLSGLHILYACMAIDFALVAYDNSKSKKFRRMFKIIVAIVYAYIISFGAFGYQILCYYKPDIDISGPIGAIALLFYFLTVMSVSVKYMYRRIKYSAVVDATTLGISLSHFMWLLLCVIQFFTPSYYFMVYCHILWVSDPLAVFTLWYFSDINFRAGAKYAFRCKCKRYAVDVVDDTVTGVVCVHKNSEAQVP